MVSFIYLISGCGTFIFCLHLLAGRGFFLNDRRIEMKRRSLFGTLVGVLLSPFVALGKSKGMTEKRKYSEEELNELLHGSLVVQKSPELDNEAMRQSGLEYVFVRLDLRKLAEVMEQLPKDHHSCELVYQINV